MTRSRFYLLFFLLAPVFYFLLKPFHVGDLAIWTALGRDSIDSSFKIIREDPYTIGASGEMVYPYFLALIYGALFKIHSFELLTFVHALIPCAWVFIWYQAVSKTQQSKDIWNWKVLVVFAVALLGTTLYFVPRPATVATVPLLLSYYLLEKNRRTVFSATTILSLVALEIIWVNIHGSFLLLPLMLIWQGIGLLHKDRKLLVSRFIALVGVLCASLLNPFGWKMYPYVLETMKLSKLRGLNEWAPPQEFFYPFASWYFFLFSAIFLIYLYGKLSKEKSKVFEIISDPFFMVWIMGFLAVRNTFLVFLFLPIFLNVGNELSTKKIAPTSTRRASRIINTEIIILLVLMIVCISPFYKSSFAKYLPEEYRETYDPRSRSDKIDEFLAQHEGLIFNTWIYGSNLALSQKNKYLLDTRNVIFPEDIVTKYDQFIEDPEKGFEAISAFDFKYFIITKTDVNALKWLQNSGKFTELIVDEPLYLFELKN